MKDSILLIDIYKRYLQVTSDMMTIVERQFEKAQNGISDELREKYKEFRKHTQTTIESFNEDLHKLLKISWELKELEEDENING
jgi:hypothetical protein